MGLFDFFSNKKKKETQPSENKNSMLLAMPLFVNNKSYNIQDVINHLKMFWQLKVADDESVDDETAYFEVDGQTVVIASMPTPIPNNEVEENAKINYLWENAIDELKNYTTHGIVTIMPNDKTPFERFSLLSKVLCSILNTSEDCIGIYHGSQTLVLSKENYLTNIDYLQNNKAPIPCWIYIGVRPQENGSVSLYTYGMTLFGKQELEIINAKKDVNELYNFILNISSYIIESDITFKDGETLGYAADHKVPIKSSKGVYVEGDTLKLEGL